MIVVTDEIRIQTALKHAKQVLDLYQQERGNFVINAVIKRDIEAVEQGDYSEIAIARLEDAMYEH
jgi:hypothetical protein